MKKILRFSCIHFLILVLTTFVVLAEQLPLEPPTEYRFELTNHRVIDGDTYEGDLHLPFQIVLKKQRIRIIGVDAWEVRGRNKHKGQKAKTFVEVLFREGRVWVSPIRTSQQRDSFGRVLGRVYIQGENKWYNVGKELKNKGHIKIEK